MIMSNDNVSQNEHSFGCLRLNLINGKTLPTRVVCVKSYNKRTLQVCIANGVGQVSS